MTSELTTAPRSAQPSPPTGGAVDPSSTNSRWWRDAVIYQVYVRSFADGNGDGNGDLLGVRSRLRYLRGLGVDALWLTPFYTSPMADGGYDVADYRDVDPIFGNLGDFKALIADAHQHGLRVIADVVPNHTSDQHTWFRQALASPPGSAARHRYLFAEGKGEHGELPPNDWESMFGGPAWTRVTEADGAPGQWYLHLFAPEQPDLNWENPEVRTEFEAILRYWLDLGVDGFRIDVAHGMVKAPGLPDVGETGQAKLLVTRPLPFFDQDGVHEIYRGWRRILDSYPGERIAVAEAWVPSAERLARYLRPDELHQAFNFLFLETDWSAAKFRDVINDSLAAVAELDAPSTWVLSNHDVPRHVTRYGSQAGDMAIGLRRGRAAALLILALPGSVYVYQGEELGLPEVLDLPEEALQDPRWERSGHTERGRDGCRVPIPWSGARAPFGFSPPGSYDTWLPQPAEWAALSVEAQLDDEESTLSLYRTALRLRHEISALGGGTLRWLDSSALAAVDVAAGDSGVDYAELLAFGRDPGFVCTVNFGRQPLTVRCPGRLLLASAGPLTVDTENETCVLPGDSAAWWAVAGS